MRRRLARIGGRARDQHHVRSHAARPADVLTSCAGGEQALQEHKRLSARNAANLARIKASGQPFAVAHPPAWFELIDPRDAPGLTPPAKHLRYRFKEGAQSFWDAHARRDWGAAPEGP